LVVIDNLFGEKSKMVFKKPEKNAGIFSGGGGGGCERGGHWTV